MREILERRSSHTLSNKRIFFELKLMQKNKKEMREKGEKMRKQREKVLRERMEK